MSATYIIYHFRPLTGGLGRRVELLSEALAPCGRVVRAQSTRELHSAVKSAPRQDKVVLLFFSTLVLPVLVGVKLARPDVKLCYMVRGDEYTWARHSGRHIRAWTAVAMQWCLARLGCRFIFVSDDLQEAFERRLGKLASCAVLPNTLGRSLPPVREFDGNVAVVGDFASVKNVEAVFDSLPPGRFRLDIYGNTRLPCRYRHGWVRAHGQVTDLPAKLKDSSLLVLASKSEGFPNVLLEALSAGCAVVAHDGFPFSRLPLGKQWRFNLGGKRRATSSNLAEVLERLRTQRPDFKTGNRELVELVESDWATRVREVLS